MATDAPMAPVEGLPSVLLLQILAFLDHSALHAAERTASVFYGLVRSESASVRLPEWKKRRLSCAVAADESARACVCPACV